MRQNKFINLFLIVAILFSSADIFSQETYYKLTSVAKVKTADTKDVLRKGSCWSNAGTAFLNAEWLNTGKEEVDISVMDFVHNSYLMQVQPYLDSKGKHKITETGMAFDVIQIARKYGMAPESAYMYPDKMDPNSAEMDAMLRGTLRMVQEKENGVFTEQWKDTYDVTLMRYIGETRIDFDFKGNTYSPLSFVEYSGLSMDNYMMITSDTRAKMNTTVDLELPSNWAKHKFHNASAKDLLTTLKNAISNGYTVLWYGDVNQDMIFADEAMAIVPAGNMPGVNNDDKNPQAQEEFNPIPEKEISAEMRSAVFEKNVSKELEYLLIYGINKDQNGNEYFEGKYVCQAGDRVLNLSANFVNLNTIYMLLNKNAIPKL